MKRGPKRYEDRTNGNGVVPTRVIAQWTGLSVRGEGDTQVEGPSRLRLCLRCCGGSADSRLQR